MTLSKSDTAFLKGIAILMIVMHNFCHWLPGCVAENEYTFEAGRIHTYLDYILQGGPHLVLNFFSHYGHYGVPLFLFLSGYGLVKKYEKDGSKSSSSLRFIWSHAVKLWKLMLPAIAIYWFCQQTMGKGWNVKPTDLLAMVTYTANLFYVRDLILGPWWFFSLILQLYIVYRLLLYPTRNGLYGCDPDGLFGKHFMLIKVICVCFFTQCMLYYFDVRMTPDWRFYIHDTTPSHWDLFNYCRYNFPTSMLPFGIGIAFARYENQSVNAANFKDPKATLWCCVIVGSILLLLSALSSAAWLISPIFLLLALVPLAPLTKQPLVRKTMEWVGGISAALFAVHPIVRAFTINYAKQAEWHGQWTHTYFVLAAYVAISLVGAWVFNFMIKKISQYVG